MRAAALLSTAGSLALTAALASPAAPAPPGDPAPRARTAAPAALPAQSPAEARGVAAAARRAAAAGIRFGDCAPETFLQPPVQCGTVRVPLDYADPGGAQATLTVSRLAADGRDGARHQGALVFAPDGPGGSGLYFPLAADISVWRPVAAAYDLVGYTPRGVAVSNAAAGHPSPASLSCQEPGAHLEGPTDSPDRPSAAYKKERVARAKAYARGCARSAGAGLAHYSTPDNARDLEVLRAALGQGGGLTFMGSAYGGYLGAVYATLFPSHVRRMVFDSPSDPAHVGYRADLDRLPAAELRWNDFLAWVARHDATYHLGTTTTAVERSYEKVRDQVAARPAGGVVGTEQLRTAFLRTVSYDDSWPLRAVALALFLRGDPGILTQLAEPARDVAAAVENADAVRTAVRCGDSVWPTDWAVWDRDHTLLARTAPFATWDSAWARLPCAFWPGPRHRPTEVRAARGALPPTLVLAAERDAVAPYPGAVALTARLAGAALVTERDAGSNGVGGGPNDCVNRRLETYLLTGRVPARGATCAAHAEPAPISLGDDAPRARPWPLRPVA